MNQRVAPTSGKSPQLPSGLFRSLLVRWFPGNPAEYDQAEESSARQEHSARFGDCGELSSGAGLTMGTTAVSQTTLEMLLVSSVTAPFRAIALPWVISAPPI